MTSANAFEEEAEFRAGGSARSGIARITSGRADLIGDLR